MSSSSRAARQDASTTRGAGYAPLRATTASGSSGATIEQPAGRVARSRPLVYDESGAIIVSDSEDNGPQPVPKFIPPRLKGEAQYHRTNSHKPSQLEPGNTIRRGAALQVKGKKRARDAEDEEERARVIQRLREKARAKQAENELVSRKLEAAER
ncbi:hypothetical protein AURDEDRAFT_131422, partial [Auricularia subglabra TFB-10046 SS5]